MKPVPILFCILLINLHPPVVSGQKFYQASGAELEGGFQESLPEATFDAIHSGANHTLGLDNVSVSEPASFESVGPRGGWFWEAGGDDHPFGSKAVVGDPGREDQTVQLFRAWEIGRIYNSISASRIASEPDVIANWNSKLFFNGIESHLLLARTSWLDAANWGDLETTLQNQFIDFNASRSSEAEHFSAIHFDVEPQVLPEWPSFNAAERRQALEDLLEMLQQVRAYLDSKGAATAYVSAAIPHWYDRLPPALGGTGTIGWDSVADRNGWYDRLAQAVDGVAVMSFNLSGATQVLDATARVRTNFDGNVVLALRVEGPEWTSVSQMIAAAEEIEAVVGGGIDIQPLYRFAETTSWRLRPSYDAWREAAFDEAARDNDTISGPLAQPADDGVANVLKYALGLGAGSVSSALLPKQEFQTVSGSGTFPALRFRRLPEATDLTYTVQATVDLVQWDNLPDEEIHSLDPVDPGTEEALAVDSVPVGDASRRFLRVRVDHTPSTLNCRQNFASLDPRFTNIYGDGHDWTDDETVPGWFASLDHYFATNNPVEGNRLFNLRAESTSTNQALGSVPGGTSGDIHVAKRLVNDTDATIESLTIAYTGEQWRNSGNSETSALVVAYRIGRGSLEDGTWTEIPELTFTAPQTGADARLLDGKTGSNRRSLRHTFEDVEWQPEQELWLRWTHANHGGMNHALAIDHVEIDGFPAAD